MRRGTRVLPENARPARVWGPRPQRLAPARAGGTGAAPGARAQPPASQPAPLVERLRNLSLRVFEPTVHEGAHAVEGSHKPARVRRPQHTGDLFARLDHVVDGDEVADLEQPRDSS